MLILNKTVMINNVFTFNGKVEPVVKLLIEQQGGVLVFRLGIMPVVTTNNWKKMRGFDIFVEISSCDIHKLLNEKAPWHLVGYAKGLQ